MKTFELNEAGLAAGLCTGGSRRHHLCLCPLFSGPREGGRHREHLPVETDFGIYAASCPEQHGQDRCGQTVPGAEGLDIVGGAADRPGGPSSPEIQELRSLFSAYRLYQKQNTQPAAEPFMAWIDILTSMKG
jgi:hypothetical protein